MSISTPQQDRSRATLQRIVQAALGLVEIRAWDDIPVTDIVRRAGSSVGAFYARFGDKGTLLGVLDDYYADTLCALLESFAQTPPAPLRQSAEALLAELVRFHTAHRGLVRTLIQAARSSPMPLYAENTRRINGKVPLVVNRLWRCSDLPAGCRKRHLEQATTFVYSAMREQLVFNEAVPCAISNDRQLIRALAASFEGTVRALARG